jgi:acetyl esterase/lipase
VTEKPISRWAAASATALVALVLVGLSMATHAAPRSMSEFPLVIGATEFSPFLVLLDLLWCLAVNRVLRPWRTFRFGMMTLLVCAAVYATAPLREFGHVASTASAQLGMEESEARYSLVTAIRGLPHRNDVEVRAVSYAAADGTPLHMQLYSIPSATRLPTVVVMYGGAWRGGDASQCDDVSRALASRGFLVAAIDYRHVPVSHFPAQLQDVRSSIQLLRDSAASWNIDVARMAVLGRSSGGHLAELTAFSPGGTPLKAVVALYAPYDLAEGYRDLPDPDPIGVREVLANFIGGTPSSSPSQYQAASPASYIRAGLPITW